MPINSKKKGNRFEWIVAKKLTEITGFKWYRVGVSSGARYTTIGAEKFRGDITTDNEKYQNIIIECKATKNRITLEDIVNPKSKFSEWIKQSIEESEGKWVLIFKANNGKMFAIEPKNCKFGEKFFKNFVGTLYNKFKIYVL